MSDSSSLADDLVNRLRSVHAGVRGELEVSRHLFRGEPSYVVRDPVTFQSHRLSVADYQVFSALRDKSQLSEVFDALCKASVLTADQETDFYRFVLRLTQLGLTNLPLGDGSAAYARFERRKTAKRKNALMSLMFLRIPLVQPDAFLQRTMRWFAPLFTRNALWVWSIAMACGSLVVTAYWDEFVDPLATMLTLRNLPLLWALLVGLKVFHEMGHAYACKHFGGNVPEMGAYLMMLTPCAYVDASASWGFPSTRQRIVVALAGMYFESIAALAALAIWLATGEGTIHSAAQYAIVLSTLVTVAFNANPLMRYDGYYIASDLAEIPNLRAQAGSRVNALMKKWFFGVETNLPPATRTHRSLLLVYGVASGVYKVGLLMGIATMIAFKVPVAGLAIAVGYAGSTLFRTAKNVVWLASRADETVHVRRRAVGVLAVSTAAVVGLFGFVPLPGGVEAPGVVQRQFDRRLHAGASGTLVAVQAVEGSRVKAGELVCLLENLELKAALPQREAERLRWEIELQRLLRKDLQGAGVAQNRLRQAEQAIQQARQDAIGLRAQAPADGVIVDARSLSQVGKYFRKGEPLATLSSGPWVVEALLSSEAVSESRPQIGERAEVRLLGCGSAALTGQIVEVAQVAAPRIDDVAALTQVGGGEIAVAPHTFAPQKPLFRLTIRIDQESEAYLRHGMTAVVRLNASRPTWGRSLYRRGLNLLTQLRLLG